MGVTVLISATLRFFTNRNAKLEFEGRSVEEILNALVNKFPESEKALFEQDRKLRPFVNVY